MTVGEKIKRSRLDAKLGLTETAKGAGLTKAGLWKIETGATTMPSVATLQALGQLIGVDFNEWIETT